MSDLRTAVFELLANAKENDYIGSDGTNMHLWTDEEVANDMRAYAHWDDVTDQPTDDDEWPSVELLKPHINEWRALHDKRH